MYRHENENTIALFDIHLVLEIAGKLTHVSKQLLVRDDPAQATHVALINNRRLGRPASSVDVPVKSVVAEVEGAVGKPPGQRHEGSQLKSTPVVTLRDSSQSSSHLFAPVEGRFGVVEGDRSAFEPVDLLLGNLAPELLAMALPSHGHGGRVARGRHLKVPLQMSAHSCCLASTSLRLRKVCHPRKYLGDRHDGC